MIKEDYCKIHGNTYFSDDKCLKCRNMKLQQNITNEKYVIRVCKKHGVEIYIKYKYDKAYVCRQCIREKQRKLSKKYRDEKRGIVNEKE